MCWTRFNSLSNAQFQNAEDVVVNGGRFTNARGDVVNNVDVGVTINLTKRMAGFKMCRLPRTHEA
jgi:flagellar capping protein FliD